MSFHRNYDKWLSQSQPQFCPVCNQAPMPEGMEDDEPSEFAAFVAAMHREIALLSEQ